MAIQERTIVDSCSGRPVSEGGDIQTQMTILTQEQIDASIKDAAAMADGSSNVWVKGVVETLEYEPRDLKLAVGALNNLEMLGLMDVLQRRRDFIVTKAVLVELAINNRNRLNLPT
jgi:hypothetical protein